MPLIQYFFQNLSTPPYQRLSMSGGGSSNVKGAANFNKKIRYKYKFALNSVVYVKQKAKLGVLERITVHKVLIGNNRSTFYQQNTLYEDTLKSLYREDELIGQQEAESLALSYWTQRRGFIVDEIVPHPTSGGPNVVKVSGSAKYGKKIAYPHKYAVDQIVFVKKKAQQGILEKITIHKVLIGNNIYTQYQENVVYEDMLKSLFREDELILQDEAESLALTYWTHRRGLIVDEIVDPLANNIDDTVRIMGSAKYGKKNAYPYKYAVDSNVFVKRKAQQGVLEKVTIHKVLVGNNIYTDYQENVMYEDKLKSLYHERELIPEAQAKELALAYWTKRRGIIVDEIVQEIAPQNNTKFG